MRILAAAAAALAAMLAVSGPALGAWSSPQRIVTSLASAKAATVATDAQGDAAVAWSACRSPSCGDGRVYVTVRLANGTTTTRLLSGAGSPDAVAIARGEVTVAWTERRRSHDGYEAATLRAAHGPLTGRWPPAQTIGTWTVFAYVPAGWQPHLAAAADGEVLLVWDDFARPIAGSAVAWRAPGHGFGAPRALTHVSRRMNGLGPVPAFDPAGAAYVSAPCSGMVFVSRAGRRRFGPALQVAPAVPRPVYVQSSALDFNLSLAGPGLGLAAWSRGGCTFDAAAGPTPGPLFASVLRGGRFGGPTAIPGADPAVGIAVASASGGGLVSWTVPGGSASVAVGPGGGLGAPAGALALVPVAADGGGDTFLSGTIPAPGTQQVQGASLAARPAGGVGGADQPAPSPSGLLATAQPRGRGGALVWNASLTGAGRALELSVWRP